jgi:hypothetical protein
MEMIEQFEEKTHGIITAEYITKHKNKDSRHSIEELYGYHFSKKKHVLKLHLFIQIVL